MKTRTVAIAAVAVLSAAAMIFCGCTDNLRAKSFGGTMEVKVQQGKKVVNATWKDSEFWYLVRDMRPGEKAEKWEFLEKSGWGTVEGKVVLIESGNPPNETAKQF